MRVCVCSHLIYFTMSSQYCTGLLYSARSFQAAPVRFRNSFPRMHLTPIVRLRPFIGSGLVLGCDGNLIGGDTLVVKGSLEVGQCRGPDSEPTSAASARLPAVQPRAGNPKLLQFGKKRKPLCNVSDPHHSRLIGHVRLTP